MRIAAQGRTALSSFALGSSVALILFPCCVHRFLAAIINFVWLPLSICILIATQRHVHSLYYKKPPIYQVAWRATMLGQMFGLGFIWIFQSSSSGRPFGVYACLLAFFHFSEYVTTAIIKPRSLKLDSFLLNHSKEYGIAAAASWVEFMLERHYFPSLKEQSWVTLIGVILCVGGEVARKLAMFTAGSNFNHIVQLRREDGHTLVKHGIYSLCRHPSYVGWFYWSLGTQLILVNPLCTIAYAYASWTFFKTRIEEEEQTLLLFFDKEYEDYMAQVPTGLPFINGLVDQSSEPRASRARS